MRPSPDRLVSGWRGVLLGIVLVAIAFAGGVLTGHLLSTSPDPEREAWEARVDSALGVAREAHEARVAALLDSVRADTAAVARLRRSADRERVERVRWQAEADTLTAMLVMATTARDSLRTYRALVDVKDSAIARETSRGDSLAAALDTAMVATARLLAVRTADSTRILSLEADLRDRPKPSRWRLRLLGLDVRPCGYAGVGIDRRTSAGVGLCATP